jgi:broad specificity phosphatase PhoE
MKLVFVRHGESEGNAEGRLQGHAEFDLSEEGRSQSQRLRYRFQKEDFQPTHIYSSPQRRAAETARIVASSWSVPLVYWDDLKEYDVGIFTGMTWDEIGKKYPGVRQEFQKFRDWDIVEGAELMRSRRDRARRTIEAVAQHHANDDSVLMFTHGGILEYMVAALMGTERTWGISVPNTAVFTFTLDMERWSLDGDSLQNPFHYRIVCFNDASHLA